MYSDSLKILNPYEATLETLLLEQNKKRNKKNHILSKIYLFFNKI